jgi:KDO2-lipid IV(A) lauroyltransferase
MIKNPLYNKQFWHPKYWPTWFGLGILRLINFLPYHTQLKIGRTAGIVGMYCLPQRRHIADVNLRLCFPSHTEAQRKHLLRENFAAIGIAVIETGMTWWFSIEKIEKLVKIRGIDNLEAALAKGRGVLLLGAHFTTLDFAGRLTSYKYPFHVTYRPSKNKLIDAMLVYSRNDLFDNAISRNTMRTMIKKLKENKMVWYAPDQDYGRKQSVFAPFFGVQAATITATARIAQMTDCAIVPVGQYRLPNGKGYEFIAYPELENFPTGNEVVDATRINQIIEHAILRAPEQYLWQHRRFKTRPEGEKRPY